MRSSANAWRTIHKCRGIQSQGFVDYRSRADELWRCIGCAFRSEIDRRDFRCDCLCSSGADAIR